MGIHHAWFGMRLPVLFLFVCVASLFSACSSPSYSGYKHSPYTIRGVYYEPFHPENAVGFVEYGIASHYDERGFFSSGKTALGEPFRAGAMAGAHKLVPLPATMRVTNLENGRSVVIRVNDRGPFIPGRVVDLTPKAAKKLGFYEQGLTDVRVEVLSVGDGRYRIDD